MQHSPMDKCDGGKDTYHVTRSCVIYLELDLSFAMLPFLTFLGPVAPWYMAM